MERSEKKSYVVIPLTINVKNIYSITRGKKYNDASNAIYTSHHASST